MDADPIMTLLAVSLYVMLVMSSAQPAKSLGYLKGAVNFSSPVMYYVPDSGRTCLNHLLLVVT